MKKILLTAVISFLIASCATDSSKNCVSVSGYDEKVSENKVESLIKEFHCVQLECTPECAVSTINKMEIADSLILVSDMNRLLAFRADGKFSHQYGVKGNAANEYTIIDTFMLDPEGNVVIVDSYTGKLLTFSIDGRFLSVDKIDQSLLSNIQDGCFVDKNTLFASRYIYNDSNTVFETINLKEGKTEEIAKTPVKTDNAMEKVGVHPFTAYDGNISYVLPFDPDIYDLSSGYRYSIKTSEKVYSEEELSKITNYSIMTYSNALQNHVFLGFTDIFETPRSIFLFCSNLYGTVIDKSDNSCFRFPLQGKESYSSLPLIGIMTAHDGKLIGSMQPLMLEFMNISDDCNANLKKLKSLQQSMDKNGNPVLLFYSV